MQLRSACVLAAWVLCITSCTSTVPSKRPDRGGVLPPDASVDYLVPVPDRGTTPDGRRGDARPDAGKPWPFAPSSYDCTSLTKGPPPRTSAVALSCIVTASCATVLVAAHRGAGVDSQQVVPGVYVPIGKFAPENTLSAYRAAIVAGADVIEADVRTTKDNQLVMMHDDGVERTTTGKGKVSELTLAEVQKLTLKTTQFPGDFSCERVPTLAEVLALARGRVNIDLDLKTARTDLVALAVQQAGMLDQVFFSSSDVALLKLARSTVAKVRLQARAKTQAELTTVLSEFTPPAEVIEIDEALLNSPNIQAIHAKGAKVFVDGFVYDVQGYTTNDPKSYQPLVNKGPDVIQVDRADLLLKLLGRPPL